MIGAAAWVGGKLLGLGKGIGSFLKSLSPRAWLIIASIALVIGAIVYHNRSVTKARAEGYASGVAYEGQRIADKAKAIQEQAEKLAADLRSRSNVEIRRVDADANRLLLRGPGKASCPAPAPVSSGGRVAPAGKADDAVAGLPDPARVDLIALPFAPTVEFARQHDQCLIEAQAWRDQREGLVKLAR